MYVVAADAADFDATVASPAPLDDFDAPDALSGHDSARVWHVEDDDDLFDGMAEGDLLLFYGDGRYVGVGAVGTAFHDEDRAIADALWTDTTSGLLYTVEEYESVDLSRAAVHAVFDYSANYYPSTPMAVPDGRVDNSLAAIREAIVRYDED